ncbi:MAG: HAD family phosphatase [Geobacteraceae bacterium]|nr:HAD family phosphatase [Geobacteraceae bacterium]
MVVIFDFDGIIVDTEQIHYNAFQRVLNPLGLGYSWEEYMDKYIGFDDRDAFREVFRATGKEIKPENLDDMINMKAAFFEQIVRQGVTAYPGVISLLTKLKGNVPLALCSGALRSDILPILDNMAIRDVFDVLVTAEDVKESKPDPQSYILAVKKLAEIFPGKDITADRCIAIEDTPAGIASALKAGVSVLAVTNSFTADRLTGAVYVTDTLESVTLELLAKLVDK